LENQKKPPTNKIGMIEYMNSDAVKLSVGLDVTQKSETND
jgi:hypothetical protein